MRATRTKGERLRTAGVVHLSEIPSKHAYTRSRTPWILADYRGAYGKLLHYISGGGMSTFGRTVHQEEVRFRQRRFLLVAAVLGVLWLVFYVF